MKCPNCGNEMVESKAGHLCISCGHIDTSTSVSITGGIATGKDGHDQAKAAAAIHAEGNTASDTDTKPDSSSEAGSETEPPAKFESEPGSKPDSKPGEQTTPQPEPAAEPTVEAAPEPASSDHKPADESAIPAADLTAVEQAAAALEHAGAPADPATDTKPEVAPEPKADKEPHPTDEDHKPEEEAKSETDVKSEDAENAAESGNAESGPDPEPTPEPSAEPKPEESSAPAEPPVEPHTEPPTASPENDTQPTKPAHEEPDHEESTSVEPDHEEPAHEEEPAPPLIPPVVASNVPASAMPASNTNSATPAPDPADMPPAGKPPLAPETHPRTFKKSVALKVTLLVIAIILGASALVGTAYLYTIAPQSALSSYMQQLAAAKTTTFAADSTTSTGSEGYKLSLKGDGKLDLNNISKPKVDITIKGSISTGSGVVVPAGGSNSGSIEGHVIVTDQTFYFMIQSFSLLSELLPIQISQDWYKTDIGETTAGKCISKGNGSGSVLGSNVLTDIPVKDAKFLGFATINGTPMAHYRGIIDNDKVKAAVEKANEKLSADCRINASDYELKNISVTYDLWRGLGKDRLRVVAVDSAAKTNNELTLDSGDYNKPVKIDAPSNARDVRELFESLDQVKGAATELMNGETTAAAPESAPMPQAAPAPQPPATADSDTTRKANLSSYLEAYKAKAKNGFLPVNPPAISLNLTDPATGQPYTIAKAKPATIGQIEYRPGGACQGPGNTPGKTGTRYLALYTLLGDGQTLHCVDNR